MKKFTFTLERVRQWREKQIAMEQARLEKLFSERGLLESRRAMLEQEANASASLVHSNTAIAASELQAIDAFRRHVISQRRVIAAGIAEVDQRIAGQQRNLMEARRRFELLDTLKEKKLTQWNADFAREIEIQAGELHLARWQNGQ